MSPPDAPAAPPPAAPPSPWRWGVCGLLLAATSLNYMDRIALNQSAPAIKLSLGIGDERYAGLETGFSVAFAVGTLVSGVLVDRVGVRVLYPVAVVGWSAFGVLSGFAPGYWSLFACRVGLGLFEAANWPCGVRTVRAVMRPAERTLGNALFHGGVGVGAMVTPDIVLACAGADGTAERWQRPFQVIGAIGLVWVLLWAVMARRVPPPAPAPAGGRGGAFTDVLLDRRFWLLALVVTAVNTPWQTYRVWLPSYLRERAGYTDADMTAFMRGYYLTAEVGAWAVGLAVLGLTRAGVGLFNSRLVLFAVGSGLVATAAAVPFVPPAVAPVLVRVAGFGALGLFATYFTLSQELSARHQGKVTGTLGAINALYLAGMYAVQGHLNARGGYVGVLAAAAVPAVAAAVAVAAFWPRGSAEGNRDSP